MMAPPRQRIVPSTTSSVDSASVSTIAQISVEDVFAHSSDFSSSESSSSGGSNFDQNTMAGAGSIPTVCSSSTEDDSESSTFFSPSVNFRSDLVSNSKSNKARLATVRSHAVTPSTTDSSRSCNASFSIESEMSRLQELEQKRLTLRHQRFSLEQRLYEFCGKHAESGFPITPSDRPSRRVTGWAWTDAQSGLRVVYSGPLNEFDQPHGAQGQLEFADGQVYVGDVRNGLRSGQGTNIWKDGQEYTGEWKGNSRNGRGTHIWPDGRKVSGQWENGHLNGKVYFSWPNGATYDGMVHKGKKHGRGVHTWSDGRVYSGSFENGKEHGFGTLAHPDSVKYRGQFVKGVKEGYGIMLWRTRTYDGEWVNNKPEGQGRVVWSNGATYTGQFHAGKYHGLGVYVWPSGKKFVGRWEAGIKNGHGLYMWPNGKKYDGEYKNGLKHGYGRLTWPDGQTYSGCFENNKRSGRGVQATETGEIMFCGIWKDDLPLEDMDDKVVDTSTISVEGPSFDEERDICSPKMIAKVDDDDDDVDNTKEFSFESSTLTVPHRPSVAAN